MSSTGHRYILALLLAGSGGCGSSSPPTGPSTGPGGGAAVGVVLFSDETGTGNADGVARLPQVQVTAGGVTGTTTLLSGRAVLNGVPAGTQTLMVRPETLPPFFAAPAPRTIQVPTTGDVLLPARLSIGGNLPNTYMAYGDSITDGDGSSDGSGYRNRLQGMLAAYFGKGTVINRGVGGTLTGYGARNMAGALSQVRPAYTLIQYATNDWSNPQCGVGGNADPPCPAVNNLRRMVRDVRAVQSLPLLATIIPSDPRSEPPSHSQWVSDLADRIRTAAREEGAVLVDLHQAFVSSGNLSRLFADTLHPNDAGYEIMAQTFFNAITHGTAPLAASMPAASGRAPIAPAGPDFVPGWARPAR